MATDTTSHLSLNMTITQSIFAALTSTILYGLLLGFYRVYLSPLAKFPGPKLAAATQWYETYFEMFHLGGGMFTKNIKKMHEQYGPIVRINPHELHINDPEYYDTIYAASAPFDKMKVLENRFNIPSAAFSTASHKLHRHRRNALAPFFTRAKMQAHAPFVQSVVDKICRRLETEYRDQPDKPVALNHMFACLSGDVITSIAFGEEPVMCLAEDFRTPWTEGMISLLSSTHLTTQFPLAVPLMNMIPDRVLLKDPHMGPVVEFRQSLDKRIRDLFRRRAGAAAAAPPGGSEKQVPATAAQTLFEVLLDSDLPAAELSESRMQHEAVSIIGAAFDTTRQALTTITFHIVANPKVYARLRAELEDAIPNPEVMPPWTTLQKLPYLAACIEEGLRIGFVSVQRSPRISATSLRYDGWTIPAGTPVSSDTFHMHSNPAVFANPNEYLPERWLGNPRGPDGRKPLSRYNVAFGRGARMCLGMQMAYCELYLMVAAAVRRFEWELYHTGREDVDFYADFVIPQPRPGSKGVRVLVK